MVMPLTGLPLLAPLHLSQVGLGPRSDCRISTTLPCRVPSAAWVISTIDFTLPVSSSMVFQRPSGEASLAETASGNAANSRESRAIRMTSSGGRWRPGSRGAAVLITKKGGTRVPPPGTAFNERSELVRHPHEGRAAVVVVLGRERRDVAVPGGDAVGDHRRLGVEQVADARRDRPVVPVVTQRDGVVQPLLGPDVAPGIGPAQVVMQRRQVAVLGAVDVFHAPEERPVVAHQPDVDVAHQLRAADVADLVLAGEAALFRRVEDVRDVLDGVGEVALDAELAEREVVVVVDDQAVAAGLLAVDVDVLVAHGLDLVRI